MNRRWPKWIGIAVLAAAVWSVGQEVAAVKVTPTYVGEHRVDSPEPWPGSETRQPGHLLLDLRLEGDALKDATRWHGLTVNDGADDLGTAIVPAAEQSQSRWSTSRPAVDRWNSIGTTSDPLVKKIMLFFQPLPRQATRIRRLKAHFTLQCGGRTMIVHIPKLKQLIGKTVDDQALAALGLEMSFAISQPEQLDRTWLDLSLKGPACAIQSIEIRDPKDNDGKPKTEIKEDADNTKVVLTRIIDDTVSLNVTVLYQQKTIVVPIVLSNIPLP